LASLTLFSIAAILVLVCGNTTVQVLIGACFLDVLGFCIINNISIRKQYIFYNLFSNLSLFMGFAMLSQNCGNNLNVNLSECMPQGYNFALWLILLSSIIKIGAFPFQGYFMSVASLTESRKNILCFISTPISGFLVLYKSLSLFPSSFNIDNILLFFAVCSITWGLIGGIFVRKLTYKKLYLNLILYGACLGFLSDNITYHWFTRELGVLFLLVFLQNNWLNYSRKHFVSILFLGLLSVIALVTSIIHIDSAKIAFYYVSSSVLTLSCVIPSLYSEGKEDMFFSKILLSFSFIALIFYYKIFMVEPSYWAGIYNNFVNVSYSETINKSVYYWAGIYAILIFIRPSRLWLRIYNNEKLQSADYFSSLICWLVVNPICFLGRILWLTIDFLIIERTFLSSLSECNNNIAKLYNNLAEFKIRNIIIFVLLGTIIIFSCYRWGL